MDLSVRSWVELYLRQHIQSAKIQLVESSPCVDLLSRMADAFWAVNDGLEVFIENNVIGFSTLKRPQILKGWRDKIRTAVCAYCDALYYELDVSDAYIKLNAAFITCADVLANSDCLLKATQRAKVIAKERRKKLYGFPFFEMRRRNA